MKITTIKNKYGIKVVKCCASCIHNSGVASGDTRICDAGEGIVRTNSYCQGWAMHPRYDIAGKGGGKVKKLAYLQYLIANYDPETKASYWRNRYEIENNSSAYVKI